MHQSGTFNLTTFRELVKASCTTGEQHIIVTYTRKMFKQTGDGHFSPIGGYHSGRDMVLILDTARFKYPPHWVSLELLFDAMSAVDPATRRPRGFLHLKAPEKPVSVCYTLNRTENWEKAETYIQSVAPKLFRDLALSGASLEALIKTLVKNCPLDSVQKFVAVRVSDCKCSGETGPISPKQFLQEFRTHPLYQEVEKHLDGDHLDEHLVGRVTALILLKPPELWSGLGDRPEVMGQIYQLTDLSKYQLVKPEIEFLRHQMENLVAFGEIPSADTNHICNTEK